MMASQVEVGNGHGVEGRVGCGKGEVKRRGGGYGVLGQGHGGWGRVGTREAKNNFSRGQMLTKAKTFLNSGGTAPTRPVEQRDPQAPCYTCHLPFR